MLTKYHPQPCPWGAPPRVEAGMALPLSWGLTSPKEASLDLKLCKYAGEAGYGVWLQFHPHPSPPCGSGFDTLIEPTHPGVWWCKNIQEASQVLQLSRQALVVM